MQFNNLNSNIGSLESNNTDFLRTSRCYSDSSTSKRDSISSCFSNNSLSNRYSISVMPNQNREYADYNMANNKKHLLYDDTKYGISVLSRHIESLGIEVDRISPNIDDFMNKYKKNGQYAIVWFNIDSNDIEDIMIIRNTYSYTGTIIGYSEKTDCEHKPGFSHVINKTQRDEVTRLSLKYSNIRRASYSSYY